MIFFQKFKNNFILLILLTFFFSPASPALAEWTILIYAQANNTLSKFAHKNFADMASIGSGKTLNMLVQWYQPGKQGTWRYKVEKDQMNLDLHNPASTDGNQREDLVDAMRWAATK